jgi:serine/threonine-protein kinase
MLTGRLPFEASDATELARMHRVQAPVPPRRLNPAIPPALEEITLKVLSKEPAARYRTADQLGRVLLSFGKLNQDKTGPIVLPKVKNATSQPSLAVKPVPRNSKPTIPKPAPEEPAWQEAYETDEEDQPVDWVTWLLGLLAFAVVFGLIPFWLYIYFSINP